MIRTPSTPASKIARTPVSTPGGQKSREEKIFVTVRVRPLSQKEQALKDQVAWDCRDEHTIFPKSNNQDRSCAPYCFDRVFDPSCVTQKVYDEGARDVALSALTGINATIFAYGQTSSGKTFTMRGITENAVKDIFEHIRSTPEREFVLKFSALEIYNETVIDLLNRDSGPLRLLDDPEKGIIVEKQVEEVAKDSHRLKSLIGICEAQRQVGETALNDTSSRSHQIIKLTVESSLREHSGAVKSYIASLNLVDLAGSEKASQTNVDGMRLKEGSHINRSLLTLMTVIRKLSVGKRSGHIHIPYRDSKLTRILQPSLGGNSRTAIICTMSPALSHIEQSRNTLSFATSAKEVTNSAKVNMVVAEKQLVRQLQNQVARLEAERRSPEPSSLCLKSQLRKKDMEIQQMKLAMEELKRQRDRAQSELDLERKLSKKQKGVNPFDSSQRAVRCLSFSTENCPDMRTPSSLRGKKNKVGRNAIMRRSITSTDPTMLVHEIRKLEHRQKQLGEEANRALEVLHQEVASHRFGSQDAAQTVAKLLAEIKDMRVVSSISEEMEVGGNTNLKDEITRLNSQGNSIASLEEKLENVQKSIDKLMMHLPTNMETSESKNHSWKKKMLSFPLRNSTNRSPIIRSPCSPTPSSTNVTDFEKENKSPQNDDFVSHCNTLHNTCEATPPKSGGGNGISSTEGTPARQPKSVNVKKMQEMFKNAAEENIRSIRTYVTELKERVAKLQYQKQLLVCQVLELEENDSSACETELQEQSPLSWHLLFEEQRKQIIMLWHLCHVSIVHRTQFYMLFRGDPDDQMYMEVELRRLIWLEQQLAEVGNASPALLGDEPASSVTSSIRALKQEREQLSKRVTSRLTSQELEMLYIKWDVPPGGKQRRLQLVNKLWTDPHNMHHIQDSAEVVAKLVGFCESKDRPSKEMFQLNFVSLSDKKSWMGWNLISNLLHF
ncbi:Kinesin-like protein nack2 [Thalictrum thalictroides]|uniref:Kinesin-like protein n=1 Tax=Thalictrum thalictroides TaxID=46969 RepID=A0A7J6VT13_THATH|nr:Kinesin-like protein nack2 [Thalictrum thalictroides]